MAITPERVSQISDEKSLHEFLATELDWPIHSSPDTFEFFPDELGLTEAETQQVRAVRQIANFEKGQPWGIFLVEFADERGIYQTALRRVLRGLSDSRRDRDASLPAWKAENLLFICTPNYRDFTFAHFKGRTHTQATLARFGWKQGETALRTLCEFNLARLRLPNDLLDRETWLHDWASAFDVEQATERFFTAYESVFRQSEALISGFPNSQQGRDARSEFTQRIFNRLLFVRFLEQKGWMVFGKKDSGRKEYLRALWEDYQAKRTDTSNFYRDRLKLLFFAALNTAHDANTMAINGGGFLANLIGHVPYLNGGLFEDDDTDKNEEIVVPDEAIAPIVTGARQGNSAGLFYAFNFTVSETTPLDVEVAVDPEMLGKVFERLVTRTERQATGSYYTPKPIVAFMCRESLKGFLSEECSRESADAIAEFVDGYGGPICQDSFGHLFKESRSFF